MFHPFFETRSVAGHPLIFAHRGGSGLAPENTMAAFDNGLVLGADGLELDVRLSSDGIVVVHHDVTLDRTTNLRGDLRRLTANELAAADAGYRFGVDDGYPFRGQDLGIPTLREVLDRHRDTRVIVELKVNHPEMARAAIAVVRAADAVERVCFGSFGLGVLRAARSLEPAIATSGAREEVRLALYRSWCRWPVSSVSYHGYQVPEWSGLTRVVSPRFVADAHRARLGVQVWTVDTEDAARRLLAWNVDALITDRPDLIVPLCRQ